MAINATPESTTQIWPEDVWEPPMPPTDLIFDDGEPLESNRHRVAMNVLIRSVQQAYGERNDFFVGGNMFIYFSSTQARNRDFRGPDFFAVLDIDGSYPRQGWVVWQEEGRYPNVIIELMSESTATTDTGTKKDIYERTFRTPDYFVFDPFNATSLQGWHLDTNQRYQPLEPNEQGWLWCQTLGFWVGTWEGNIEQETGIWLRFYHPDGNLVLLPEEAVKVELMTTQEQLNTTQEQLNTTQEQLNTTQEHLNTTQEQLTREQQRAEALAAHLRQLGIDPDQLS